MLQIAIKYDEVYCKKGQALAIPAPDGAQVQIMEAIPVGDEVRVRYVIVHA